METRNRTRREALILVAAASAGPPRLSGAPDAFTLPPLPYATDALEPHIDALTMEIHHDRHHAGYVQNLNTALANHADWRSRPVEEILRQLDRVPETIRTAVRNNGGGHANHTLFWQILSPKGGGQPKGDLAKAIDRQFGSFDKFRGELSGAALGRFGSGWAWLTTNREGSLRIESTANQDSPLSAGRIPVLGIDVWEHAYYLKYQNRRADYVQALFHVIHWERVAELFEAAT